MYDKLINEIVWWIPFKKKRDKYRNLLIDNFNKKDEQNIINIISRTVSLIKEENNYEIKKDIFKKNVQHIEIGISSFCNRRCWFCPNSLIERNKNNIELDEKLFIKLLNELREINYSNELCLHRYNEPLYDINLLLKRIKQVKEYLPDCNILIYSNGDYLTREYLEQLKNAGVNILSISYYYDHLDKNIPFDVDNIIKPGMDKLLKKLGLDYKVVYNNPEEAYILNLDYDSMLVIYKATNFKNVGSNRGGTIDNVKIITRKSQCFLPIFQVIVDYDGNYTPCCNIRSDIEKHKNYILGNIKTDNVFDIFLNQKIINLRKQLLIDNRDKEDICAQCSDYRNWRAVF